MIERVTSPRRSSEVDDARPEQSETQAPKRPVPEAAIDLDKAILQAKMSVGPAGDAYEREADDVAARVVRTLRAAPPTTDTSTRPADAADSNPRVERNERPIPAHGGDGSGDTGSSDESGDGDTIDVGGRLRRVQRLANVSTPPKPATQIRRIQRSATGGANIGLQGGDLDADTTRVLKASRGGGKPLPDPARSKMESAFGADFSGIRVHSGPTATDLNERIQAKAFTTGNDIYFRDSVPDASTSSGQELLAHELTHTIQQGAAVHRSADDSLQRWSWPFKKDPPPPPPKISGPGTLSGDGSFTPNPHNRSEEGISAPANVHKRSGSGPIEKQDSIDPVMREDPTKMQLGDSDLSLQNRDQVSGKAAGQEGRAEMGPMVMTGEQVAGPVEMPAELGSAPVGGAVPGAHQQFPTAEELGENEKLFPAPSMSDVDLPTMPVLDDDPIGVISAYTQYAGNFLKIAQRHDTKIERYARYFEADYEAVHGAKVQWEAATESSDAAAQKKITKDMGGKPDTEFAYAGFRLKRAHIAEAATDKEVPLVDGIYEQARDVEKEHKDDGGGRSIPYTEARIAALETKKQESALTPKAISGYDAKIQKHQARLVRLKAARSEGGRLGNLVKQAKLSEDDLRIKRTGLQADKKEVKETKGRGVKTHKHYASKAGAALLGAGASLLTLGIVSFSQDKDDGGYSSTRRATPIWVRVKDELRRIKDMTDKRPYGPATTFHAVLESFSFVIKEIRNILASVAVLASLAALIPAATVVAGAIAGTASTLAIGFAALKLMIDAVLASWSVIERIRNTNARNSDLLSAQAVRQGGDVVADAIALGAAYGGPAAGNAVAGEKVFDGAHERIDNAGWTPSAKQVSNIPAHLANTGVKVGGTIAGQGVKGAAATEGFSAVGGQQDMRLSHMRQDRRDALGVQSAGGDGEGPVAKPEWLIAAEAEENEARQSSLDALIQNHSAKIKRFHAKTQNLMKSSVEFDKDAPKLAQKAPAEDAEPQEDQQSLIEMARGLKVTVAGVAELTGEVDADAISAHVAQ